MTTIPHSRPTLGKAEIRVVQDVLESMQIAQGDKVARFEQAFARYLDVPYAACTNSGTSALHLILVSMGIGPGDEVIIPSYVCTALLNAVHYIGASPVLADIDPNTYNMDPADVKQRISKKTKAVVVPHMFGLAADMEGFLGLGVPIIEDCAQAVGGKSGESKIGTLGHAAIFSFYATKVMTTAEGGMVVTDSKHLIDTVKDLRDYDEKDHYIPRFNYKMTDINASVGMVQLSRLESFVERRKHIAGTYNAAFMGLPFRCPPDVDEHIYFRYILQLDGEAGPMIEALRQKGVGCARPVYRPIHDFLGIKGYARTEQAWKTSVSIPIYPLLTEEETHRIVKSVKELCTGKL
jgi:perosamine synthetase